MTGDELDITIVGASEVDHNDPTVARIKAALDALEGPNRFRVYTSGTGSRSRRRCAA